MKKTRGFSTDQINAAAASDIGLLGNFLNFAKITDFSARAELITTIVTEGIEALPPGQTALLRSWCGRVNRDVHMPPLPHRVDSSMRMAGGVVALLGLIKTGVDTLHGQGPKLETDGAMTVMGLMAFMGSRVPNTRRIESFFRAAVTDWLKKHYDIDFQPADIRGVATQYNR